MNNFFSNIGKSFKYNRGFLIINIAGLAIGLGVSVVLLMFVATELSYDRHFANHDRIVQLNSIWTQDGNKTVVPLCLRSAYTDLPAKIPGIESAVQIFHNYEVVAVRDQQQFRNIELLHTDPEFFDVFQMHFIYGGKESSLQDPNTVVLTDRISKIIFGSTDAVGKSFSIDGILLTVSGVVKALPVNTHFTFDVLTSIKSKSYLSTAGGQEFFTYYLMKPGVSQTSVNRIISAEYSKMLQKTFSKSNATFEASLQKLTDLHLHPKAPQSLGTPGNIQSVLLLAGFAFLILLLAISNFVNLLIVQGNSRAVEIGIRKANGGGVKELAIQFFSEASAVVLVAFAMGLGLANILFDPFCSLIRKPVEPSIIFTPMFIFGLIGLLVFTIVLSASYPALYLSRFRTIEVLRKSPRSSKRRFTKTITIFQSVITIVLITMIFVVNKQIRYLHDFPKGYNPGNVLIITDYYESIGSHYPALKESLEKLPKVKKVSASQHVVGGKTSGQAISLFGASDGKSKSIDEYRILPDLCELMQFELVEGRFYRSDSPLNKTSVVLNEEAIRMLGITGPAVGQKVVMHGQPLEIIGVVRNFYYTSPAAAVAPIVLTYTDRPQVIYVRFDPSVPKADMVKMVLPVFRQFDSEFFMNAQWGDDIYYGKFDKEQSLSNVIAAGTLLSLIIALLGLFAIHSYSASRRTKEIGIRKVFGESSWSLLSMLSLNVIKWVAIAGILAIPISFFATRSWLENYTNRINIDLILLALPVLLQVILALAATMLVSLKVSTRNPVEALRYE